MSAHLVALAALGWVLAYLYGFWLLYVLIMGFYRAYLSKRLTKPALVLASPALIVGYLVDLFANWTIATVWFMEFPRRPLELVTDRLAGAAPSTPPCPRSWLLERFGGSF